MRPSYMEIDLNKYLNNIHKIKKFIGPNINLIPVIKANGYGTYINKSNIINNFNIVAVALVEEAIELRNNGYKNDILVLNQPSIKEIDNIFKYQITPSICNNEFLDELIKRNKEIKVHIEIDTGMGRTGIKDLSLINKIINYPKIKVDGIFTHLSSADNDKDFTNKQIDSFNNYLKEINKKITNIKYIHMAASNGILNYQNSYFNTVRVGIISYGYESYKGALNKLKLEPISKLVSEITYLKEVDINTPISYNHTYYTKRKTKVATIPLGYADGIRRDLSNKGYVVINNKKAPIIGNICMDSFMIDVTDIDNVKLGTKVYIWDNEIIKIEDIATLCHTINYEIISTISNRIPRVFK